MDHHALVIRATHDHLTARGISAVEDNVLGRSVVLLEAAYDVLGHIEHLDVSLGIRALDALSRGIPAARQDRHSAELVAVHCQGSLGLSLGRILVDLLQQDGSIPGGYGHKRRCGAAAHA